LKNVDAAIGSKVEIKRVQMGMMGQFQSSTILRIDGVLIAKYRDVKIILDRVLQCSNPPSEALKITPIDKNERFDISYLFDTLLSSVYREHVAKPLGSKVVVPRGFVKSLVDSVSETLEKLRGSADTLLYIKAVVGAPVFLPLPEIYHSSFAACCLVASRVAIDVARELIRALSKKLLELIEESREPRYGIETHIAIHWRQCNTCSRGDSLAIDIDELCSSGYQALAKLVGEIMERKAKIELRRAPAIPLMGMHAIKKLSERYAIVT